jgi:hypothetical protein
VRPSTVMALRTPGHGLLAGSGYLGEEPDPAARPLLRAIRDDDVDLLLVEHPELIIADRAVPVN